MPVRPIISEYLDQNSDQRVQALEQRIATLEATVRSLGQAFTVDSAGNLQVQATTVTVDAASIQVNCAMTVFSGVVQCDTIIATTVAGTTYTPGAGNVW